MKNKQELVINLTEALAQLEKPRIEEPRNSIEDMN